MRDDLHRTPALPRPWRTAVRYASRAADADRVAYAMSRAVAIEMNAGIDKAWLARIDAVMRPSSGDLFPEQTRLEAFRAAEQCASHPVERLVCETARALWSRSPETPELLQASLQAVHQRMLDNDIEHAVADVRMFRGPHQASLLRESMTSHRAECSVELGAKKRPTKLKGDALLNFEIPTP